MVLALCRRVLRHLQDAEDARQHVFIVLARKAPSLIHEETIGGWLRGVARHIAMKALRSKTRRQNHEARYGCHSPAVPVSEAIARELQTVLHEEVQRLPEKLRALFVLCCLKDKSKAEAARELGWKEGTVSSRLAKARRILEQRLRRCGFIP